MLEVCAGGFDGCSVCFFTFWLPPPPIPFSPLPYHVCASVAPNPNLSLMIGELAKGCDLARGEEKFAPREQDCLFASLHKDPRLSLRVGRSSVGEGGGGVAKLECVDQALCTSAFTGQAHHNFTTEDLEHLLSIDMHMSQVVVRMWMVEMFFDNKLDIGLTGVAKEIITLRSWTTRATAKLQQASRSLTTAPLTVPLSLMKGWLEAVAQYIQSALDATLASAAGEMLALGKDVDASCPRWGAAVDDSNLNLEMGKVILLTNPLISQLPGKLQKLWQSISQLTAVGAALELPVGINDYAPCKEQLDMAMNALAFGKLTVKVSAALHAVVSGSSSDRRAILSSKSGGDLPKSIVERLRAMECEEEPSASNGPARLATGGPSSGGKAMKVEQHKQGLKRKASASNMAMPVDAGGSASSDLRASPAAKKVAIRGGRI